MPADPCPSPPAALLAEVERQSTRPSPPALDVLVEALRDRFGDSLDAVLHYGSCLHNGDPRHGIVDLFALVRDYAAAYSNPVLRVFNAVLPPNVFYLEVGEGDEKIRAKYSVLSRRDFARGTCGWFHSYVWARFAQPCRILWCDGAQALERVKAGLAGAVLTFHREAVPTFPDGVMDAESLWAGGLTLTYGAELRPEGGDRVRWLVSRNGEDYARLTEAAAHALPELLRPPTGEGYRISATDALRRAARVRWAWRRGWGKILSVLRLGKSALTFAGAADYVAYKIERHTGTPIRVTPFMRRHPFLCAPYALVSFLRRGVIR